MELGCDARGLGIAIGSSIYDREENSPGEQLPVHDEMCRKSNKGLRGQDTMTLLTLAVIAKLDVAAGYEPVIEKSLMWVRVPLAALTLAIDETVER